MKLIFLFFAIFGVQFVSAQFGKFCVRFMLKMPLKFYFNRRFIAKNWSSHQKNFYRWLQRSKIIWKIEYKRLENEVKNKWKFGNCFLFIDIVHLVDKEGPPLLDATTAFSNTAKQLKKIVNDINLDQKDYGNAGIFTGKRCPRNELKDIRC